MEPGNYLFVNRSTQKYTLYSKLDTNCLSFTSGVMWYASDEAFHTLFFF